MTKCKEQALDSKNRKDNVKDVTKIDKVNKKRLGKVKPNTTVKTKKVPDKVESDTTEKTRKGTSKSNQKKSQTTGSKTSKPKTEVQSKGKTKKNSKSSTENINLNKVVSAPVNQDIVMTALRRDAQELYSTGSIDYCKYVNDNKIPYFVLVNTWYIQLKEYAGKHLPDFQVLLASKGLIPLIKEAKDVSNAIIQNEVLPQSFFSSLLHYNLAYGKTVQEALQVLRYPKRFSPFHTDGLEKQCLTDFLARNNRAKMINRKELPYWLITYLREIISVVLKRYKVADSFDEYESFSSFPTGTTAEGHKTFVQKFLEMENDRPFYFGAIGAYRTPKSAEEQGPRYCVATSVPKTAESRRIIAEEQSNRQVDMYDCLCELDKCIATSQGKYGTATRVTLHDQSRNQRLALQGSLDGRYATIDCTAASDSVTADRVRSVFPPHIVKQWDSLRSEYVDVGGKRHTLHLYSTMGSRLTFPIETLLFWAIAVAATETVCRYTHTRFNADDISAYGDDLIVPSFAYETVVEFLELCGFEVNREKSYSTGLYRESCGEEYYAGYNVSSHYYPRRQLPFGEDEDFDVATAVVQLCELQHKLYSFSECNTFLSELVNLLYPQITYSSVGERYSDLWSDYMPKSVAIRPYGTMTITKGVSHNIYKVTNASVPVPKKRYYVTDRSGKTTVRYYSDVPFVSGRSIICCDTSAVDEYHTTILTKYDGNPQYTKDTDRLAYIRFLKEGPMYADPLLQLLGISDKPVRESLCDRGHAKLTELVY